jgi:hypothetical protein
MEASHLGLLLGALLGAGCNCNDPDEDDTGKPEVPERDRGQWLSMGVLSSGTPVAAFYDRTEDGLGFALGTVTSEGVTWTWEEVDGFKDSTGLDSGNRGTYTSLAVGAGDVVWVAYRDEDNLSLRYARRHLEASARPAEPVAVWETGVADGGGGITPDAGQWASMALDPEGNPVIAHYDVGEKQLRVVRWADGAFGGLVRLEGEPYHLEDTGGQTKPGDIGSFADLAIGPDGTEYIAFYDAAWTRLQLAVGGAAGYTVTTVDDDGDVGQWPSVLVADDGALRIAYHDVGNQDLKVATGRPGDFTIAVVDDGPYAGADAEIFQNGDMVSVLYFDGQNDDLKLATRAGQDWTTSTIGGSDGTGLGFHNNVVLAKGTYYAGCYDYTNRGLWLGAIP